MDDPARDSPGGAAGGGSSRSGSPSGGEGAGARATLSPLALAGAATATPPPPPLRLPPEVEEARAKLVKALHGTLLQTHINAPGKQAAAVDALLKMVQARSRTLAHACVSDSFADVRCEPGALK
jgi:hypothetical protein